MSKKILQKISVAVLFLITLSIAGFLHYHNMFNYPYYEGDEGTYLSQAWSLLKEGNLSPYTYWYDHPPGGWIFIAAWTALLGGDFFYFGTAIDTGRFLMFLIHIVSTALVFFIVQRVTKNAVASLFAGVLFSISPAEIYFQRRVLLDNIMMLWVLASIATLFVQKIKLRHYIMAGVFFAFSILTKVTAVMFGPALLLLIFFQKSDISKLFRTASWLSVSILITTVYFLFSFLRGEFLPAKNGEHVSLIESTLFQMSRDGGNVPFWDVNSNFYIAVGDWMNKDEMGIIVATGVIILALLSFAIQKEIRFFVGAIVLYFIFLVRGGVVINFYIIPLFPFFAITASILFYGMTKMLLSRELMRSMLILVPLVVVCVYYGYYGPTEHFTKNDTEQQRNAITWIKENVPNDDAIIIDSYALIDIRDPDNINEKTFPNADWFYKINRDPAIRDYKYGGNWENFDYIALTHEMLKQMDVDKESIVREAYRNSLPVAKWLGSGNTFVDEQSFRTTNGDWAMIFKVNGSEHAQLRDSWDAYKQGYIVPSGADYGRVTDPVNGMTTSEGQSYAMLRAAWMNDRKAFDASWLWTQNHLQYRLDDKLFSWKWQDGELQDSANATDADEDIALALLFAYKLWNDDAYLESAKVIIDDLWETAVVKINGRFYFLPMHETLADKETGYLFNPSYLSPASYRIFAEVDTTHEWSQLADDSYKALDDIGSRKENKTYLPSDWLILDKKYGGFYTAEVYFTHDVDKYSFDAFRIVLRVALDDQWFHSPAAKDYLQKISTFPEKSYRLHGKVPMIISIDGAVDDYANSLSTDTGHAIALKYAKSGDDAGEFFEKFIQNKYLVETDTWSVKPNYYDANWAWFGTGIYHGILQNVWNENILYK